MIELQNLAKSFETLLGSNDFHVYWDAMTEPERDSKITPCTLQASRVPFALNNLDAETLNIKLTFDLLLIPTTERDRKAKIIREKLLGWVKLDVIQLETEMDGDTYEKTYTCDAFFSQMPPLADPRPDTGIIIQQVTMQGTMLVSSNTSGMLTANRVDTYIDDFKMNVLGYGATVGKGAENVLNLSAGATRAEMLSLTNSNVFAFTLLFANSLKDKEFISILEGGEEKDGINTTYKVQRTYPDGTTYTNVCKLVDGTLNHQAGAFLYYTLTFQKIE